MIIQAIKALRPNAQWNLIGTEIVWNDKEQSEPSKEEIEKKIKELETQAKIDAEQTAFNNAIQTHLDTKAQSLRYDNINSIGKYVGYENDFRTEAEKLGAWASSCWKVVGNIEVAVNDGIREMPTVEEVITELPLYE